MLIPPKDWERRFFAGKRDDELLSAEDVRKLVLEDCEFEYVTHAVKAGSLYTARSATVATSDAARAAAALADTRERSRAATVDDHREYRNVFNKHFDTLVRIFFVNVVCWGVSGKKWERWKLEIFLFLFFDFTILNSLFCFFLFFSIRFDYYVVQ